MREQVLKTTAMQRTEHRLGEPIETYLERRYHEDGATLAEIANDLKVQVSTVSRWMAQLGIATRYTGQRGRPTEASA